jgi:hypothetical protein
MARPLRVEFEDDGLDYAAVAQRIRRTRLAHSARATSQLRKEMLNVEI